MFWWAELISQFFCNLKSSKNFTCLLGKFRTEFTSPGLWDTAFFAEPEWRVFQLSLKGDLGSLKISQGLDYAEIMYFNWNSYSWTSANSCLSTVTCTSPFLVGSLYIDSCLNLFRMATSLQQPLSSDPKVAIVERVNCIRIIIYTSHLAFGVSQYGNLPV